MNKNSFSKREYESIPIPKELDKMINQTISNHAHKTKKLNTRFIAIAASLLVVFSTFTTTLNISQSFAESMTELPLLNTLAQILTFRTYSIEKDEYTENVETPVIANLTNKNFEDTINNIIQEKVAIILGESELRVEEYKIAYIETGGTEESFKEKDLQVNVGYNIKLQSDEYLSFLVYTNDAIAAVYAEYMYYNIDLKTSEMVTLEDLFGSDYVAIISNSIKGITANSSDDTFYFDDFYDETWQVSKDVDFYLNTDGHPVVVLDKYELAPGAAGRLEFEIIQ